MTRRVVLLAGPPGAGKTTRAHALAAEHGLTVYDRDDARWPTERAFRAALAAVGASPIARAAVIRTCATHSAWQRAVRDVHPTATELLAPPAEVCISRVLADGGHRERARLAGVHKWFSLHAAAPWSPDGDPFAVQPAPRLPRAGRGRPGEGRRHRELSRAVLAAKGTVCHLCRTEGADSADHIVPRSKGGLWVLDNLMPAHHECNARRGDLSLAEWFARHPVSRRPVLPPSREW